MTKRNITKMISLKILEKIYNKKKKNNNNNNDKLLEINSK